MSRRASIVLASAAALAAAAVAYAAWSGAFRPARPQPYEHVSFLIDGKAVPLDGKRLSIVSGPTPGDLDGDGRRDAAVTLAYQPGGSGTFIYAAAVMDIDGARKGTNAVLLGDRVAPESAAVSNGMIVATYLDRGSGEPMTAKPTIETKKYIRVEDGTLSAMPKP